MMNNIFLVKSPLQLINALEAKYQFSLNDDSCLLIIMGDRKSYPQMLNLAKINRQWRHIILMNEISMLFSSSIEKALNGLSNDNVKRETLLRSSLFTIPRLNQISKNIIDADHVFIGDYNYVYMRHFVNTVPHNKTILLDDGVGTLNVANRRLNGLNTLAKERWGKKIKVAAKRLFLGLQDQEPDHICYFTAYDVQLNRKDQSIKNEFRNLRDLSQSLEITDSIYFIGSPLSEVGIMSEKKYLEQLLMVKEFFNGSRIIYVAHRREAQEKLNKIESNLNMDICHFEYPIEYQIAIVGPKPKIITSFITSALENLRIIMGNQVKIISFKLIDGTYSKKQIVDDIYDHYNQNLSDHFYVESLY